MSKTFNGALCAGVFSLGLAASPMVEAGLYTIDFWFSDQGQDRQNITINGAALTNVEIVSEAPIASATMEIDDSVDGIANGFVPLRSGDIKLSPINIGEASYSLPGDVTRDMFLNIADPDRWLGVRFDASGRALRFDIPAFSVSNSGSIVDDEFSVSPLPQLTLDDHDPIGSQESYIHKLADGTFALLAAGQAERAGFVQRQFQDLTQITALGQQAGIGQLGEWHAPFVSTGQNLSGFLRIARTDTPPPPVNVSEPQSLALMSLGLAGLIGFGRKKNCHA